MTDIPGTTDANYGMGKHSLTLSAESVDNCTFIFFFVSMRSLSAVLCLRDAWSNISTYHMLPSNAMQYAIKTNGQTISTLDAVSAC